jgi:sulfur carrier protein
MVEIWVNGGSVTLEDNTSVDSLIDSLGLSDRKIAIEINHQIVSRSRYDSITLKHKDKIEIVTAVGGG